jgi:hypothetical protein
MREEMLTDEKEIDKRRTTPLPFNTNCFPREERMTTPVRFEMVRREAAGRVMSAEISRTSSSQSDKRVLFNKSKVPTTIVRAEQGVGVTVGEREGGNCGEGKDEGDMVGDWVGVADGAVDGLSVGAIEGIPLGTCDGTTLG